MSSYHIKRSAAILRQIVYITIATASKDGHPWNSPVFSAFDKELNFFWASDKNSQHSRNIRENQRVFLVVYDSTVPEGKGEGVYIQATAREIDKKSLTIPRWAGTSHEEKKIEFTGDRIRSIYTAVPERIWINDVERDGNGEYIRDIRVDISQKLLLSYLINN